MTWLRNEYGYPEGYPQKKELTRLLPILKYPSEVNKIKVKQPEKQKAGEDIPTSEEMQYVSDASINPSIFSIGYWLRCFLKAYTGRSIDFNSEIAFKSIVLLDGKCYMA